MNISLPKLLKNNAVICILFILLMGLQSESKNKRVKRHRTSRINSISPVGFDTLQYTRTRDSIHRVLTKISKLDSIRIDSLSSKSDIQDYFFYKKNEIYSDAIIDSIYRSGFRADRLELRRLSDIYHQNHKK